MSDSATIIRDGDAAYRLQITRRDWMLIKGPGFVEGPIFIAAFGMFENFTVAGGIAKGSLVHREGQTLFDASSTLLAGIKRDQDLLAMTIRTKSPINQSSLAVVRASLSTAGRRSCRSVPRGIAPFDSLMGIHPI